MKKTKTREGLANMFVPVGVDSERVAFNSEYMLHENSPHHDVYTAVSDAMHTSGLSFDFAYIVGQKACDILAEVEDWGNEGAITDAIDGAMPIYNAEIMQIYAADFDAVDEACEELGLNGSSVDRALAGWYLAISNMVEAIREKLA